MEHNKNSFFGLKADWAMTAIEALGLQPTGEFFKLNSYENRVFDIFLEKGTNDFNDHVIIKVYRPKRWSIDALREEQEFLNDLATEGIPVIQSLFINNKYIFEHQGLYFSIYKKGIGRLPQELNATQLKSIGRILAHIHNVGESKESLHRNILTAENYGWKSLDILDQWIAPEIKDRYINSCETILNFLDEELEPSEFIRIHGDCHRGNLIINEDSLPPFQFVDFDDFCMGPIIQDFWMLLPGNLEQSENELKSLITGYEEFRSFPDHQIKLIEPLRGLRIIYYAAWIAKRWDDPTFPQLFPTFQDYLFWVEEVEILEKIAWSL